MTIRHDAAVIEGPADRAQALLEAVQAAMTPAPEKALKAWIGELSLIAPKRAEDDMVEDARLRAYCNRLADYPADVAREALLKTRWQFFPSWAELAAECDRLVKQRLLVLAAAKRAAAMKAAEPITDPEHRPPTEEERARRRAFAEDVMRGFVGRARSVPTHAEIEAEKAREMTTEAIAARPYTDAERARMAALGYGQEAAE